MLSAHAKVSMFTILPQSRIIITSHSTDFVLQVTRFHLLQSAVIMLQTFLVTHLSILLSKSV